MAESYTPEQFAKALTKLLNGETGPSTKRTYLYNNKQSTTEANFDKIRESFEKQKEEALRSYKETCEEEKKLKQNQINDIFKMEISSREKLAKESIAQHDYILKLQQANEEKKEKLKTIAYKEELVQKQRLADFGIATHLQDLKKIQDETASKLAGLNAIKIANGELTEDEQEQYDEAAKAHEEALQKELKIRNSLRESEELQISNANKILELQEKQLEKEKKLKEAEDAYNNELAETKALFESGEIKDENRMARDISAKNKFSEAKQKIEATYGSGNIDLKNIKAKDLFEAASKNAGDTGIGKTVTDVTKSVKNISNIVQGLKNGNPVGLLVSLLTGILKAIDKLSKTIDKGVIEYESLQQQYLNKVNTRLDNGDLQNSRNFDDIALGFSAIFGGSRYVNQKSLIANLASLVEKGVVFNVEQRAILSELSERMAATFSMVDEHLLELTKLQQADMSVAQLGAESRLLEFFNNTFEDNSYMSAMYDSVTSTLMDALSTMTAQESVAFNYSVNKWLGSLYSLGMSQSGVSRLAEGINALATGNTEYFSGNDAARVLFASASGGAFADALVNGLNASNVDKLLGNIVEYLAEISTDTNNVTKQVKAGIFGGLSYSDIRAVSNLAKTDVEAIQNSQITWESAKDQVTGYLMDFASQNTVLSTQIKNLIDNTSLSLGQSFMQDENDYTLYKIGQTVGGVAGELLMADTKINGFVDTLKALTTSVSGSFNSLSDSLTHAGNFNLGEVTSYTHGAGILGTFLGDLIHILTGDRQLYENQSFFDLSDAALINGRGQAFVGKNGVSYGISSSMALDFSNSAVPAVTYNSSDVSVKKSLNQQATTIESGLTNYENGASAIRDINSLYAELFENQVHPIRVSVANIEDKVLYDISSKEYRVSDEDTHSQLQRLKFSSL